MSDIDIHTWFSLTYANYLVLPRSVLQSMPEEWQQRFISVVRELDESFGHLDWPSYDVRALKREREFITPYEPCDECDDEGLIDGEPCEYCQGEGEVEQERRYETAEEVGFRDDPIPHYDRGRTKLEPKT